MALTVFVLSMAGCTSYGPGSLNKDQLNYGVSIGETWKDQMLANLVKIRFVDMPVFVDVGQIVSGYSIETSVDAALGFSNSLLGDDSQVLGAQGKFTDRPTITYMPKTGEAYLRSLLEPVDPGALLSLIMVGYDAELLFTWAVESINGVRNHGGTGDELPADPEYLELVELLREMQRAGAVGFEVENDPETAHKMIFFFRHRGVDPETEQLRDRVREIIDLDPNRRSFRVLYSPFAMDEDVLAVQTRSIMQMLIAMSKFVDVPEDKSGRAMRGLTLPAGSARPFHVHTSAQPPEDTFASFRYDGDWYWIDHEDLVSKRVFMLMLFLTTLTNRAPDDNAPVLTIPTN